MAHIFNNKLIHFLISFLLFLMEFPVYSMEQAAKALTAVDPHGRFYHKETSLRAVQGQPLFTKSRVLAAIDTTDVDEFQKALHDDELNSFKQNIMRTIRTDSKNPDLVKMELQNLENCNTYKELTEYLVCAFSPHSLNSLAEMGVSTPINELYEPIIREPETRKRLATFFLTYSDLQMRVLKVYKAYAMKNSRLWYGIHYFHIYALPILMFISAAALAIEPIWHMSVAVLVQQLYFYAIPFYVFTLLYVSLFIGKLVRTGSLCGVLNKNPIEINDILASNLLLLQKLHDQLSQSEKHKSVVLTLTPTKIPRGGSRIEPI